MLNRHQFRTYYHGTQLRNVQSILKHGIEAHNPAEGWDGLEEGEEEIPGHPTGVYLSTNLEVAKGYGDAVFSVELPDSADWGDTVGEGHVLRHSISPFALKRVQ